jgi:hypothetical protein
MTQAVTGVLAKKMGENIASKGAPSATAMITGIAKLA